MRALVQPEFGDPTEVLSVQEVPDPEPGPGQALVRVLLSPIHNHDLWTVRGSYGFKPGMPARAGTEAVGVVEVLGEGVTTLDVGQRVATGGSFGAWAELIVAPAAGLVPVPDGMSDESAAQLVSMPFSAIALLDSLDLSEGDWFVQNAANGAVGRLVAQLAEARGVNVLGLVRRSAGGEELREQGIGNVVGGATVSARSSATPRSWPAWTPSAAARRVTWCRCSRRTACSSSSVRWPPPPSRSPPAT